MDRFIMAPKVPASIRYKNPGAMWGSPLAIKWGAQPNPVVLKDGKGQGNNIAVFPTFVQGICAQLDLWRTSRNYRNKRFADAIAIWCGGNATESYISFVTQKVPSMTRDTVMNDAFWHSPMGVEFLKAQAAHEAGRTYPAPDEDWVEAQRRVFDADEATPATSKGVVAARTVGGTVAAVTAGTQVISAVTGPVTEQIGQVKEIVAAGGQVVDTTTHAIKVVPVGTWGKVLAFIQSPTFLATAVIVIGLAWFATWYLRKQKEQGTST